MSIEKWRKQHGGKRLTSKQLREASKYKTGSVELDAVLEGGLIGGVYSVFWGPEGSGKTSTALKMAGKVLADGGRVLWIDQERALLLDPDADPDDEDTLSWLAKNGFDIDSDLLDVLPPQYGEVLFQIIEDSIINKVHDLIVVDSWASVGTKRELDGEYGDASFGSASALASGAFKRLGTVFGSSGNRKTHVIFTNQARANMDSPHGGNKQYGGKALPHYASYVLEFRATAKAKIDSEGEATKPIRVRITKNRINGEAETNIQISSLYGIDLPQEILDYGLDSGKLVKEGSWYLLVDKETGEEVDKFHGRNKTKAALVRLGLVTAWYDEALEAAREGGE